MSGGAEAKERGGRDEQDGAWCRQRHNTRSTGRWYGRGGGGCAIGRPKGLAVVAWEDGDSDGVADSIVFARKRKLHRTRRGGKGRRHLQKF